LGLGWVGHRRLIDDDDAVIWPRLREQLAHLGAGEEAGRGLVEVFQRLGLHLAEEVAAVVPDAGHVEGTAAAVDHAFRLEQWARAGLAQRRQVQRRLNAQVIAAAGEARRQEKAVLLADEPSRYVRSLTQNVEDAAPEDRRLQVARLLVQLHADGRLADRL